MIHQIGFSSRCFHELDPPLCGASLILLGSATNFSGECCLVYPFGISWDFFSLGFLVVVILVEVEIRC